MAISKVDYFGQTLIDLTGDTVTPQKLLKGITAHDKAGNAIVGTAETGPALPKDPHTLLLLHGESMEDSGKYNVPLTNNGVVVSNAQSRFGGKSLYFDGNAWINFPQKYAPYMDKDFTIDWWEYCMTSDENHQSRYFSTDAGGQYKTLGLLLGHLGKQAYCGNGWSMINGADMFNIAQNQWVHWAAVRHGNTFTTYRNGKKFAQTPIVGSIPYDEKTMHCIGGWRYSPGQKWIGYMDEFRISDVARWTSDFVPQNAPYENVQECKDPVIKPLKVTKNGTTPISEDADGWGPVEVAVPSDKKPETAGSEIIKTNGKTTFNPPAGGVFSSFTADVQVPVPVVPEAQEKELTITENGDYPITPDVGKVLSKVLAHVNVSGGGGGSEVIQIGTHYAAVGSITLAAPATRDILVEHEKLPRTGVDTGMGWIAIVDWNSKRNASTHSTNALHLAWKNMNPNSIGIYTLWYTSGGSTSNKSYGANLDAINFSSFYINKDSYSKMIPGVEYTWIHCV